MERNVNADRRVAQNQAGLRNLGCACLVALLAGCASFEQLSANSKSYTVPNDGRILLGATQRISVRPRDAENYTCGSLTMMCLSWGPSLNCHCE
jgi:uncharacterized lipoprotein YajG